MVMTEFLILMFCFRKCRCNRDKYPRQRGGGALQLNYFRNNQRPINSPCSLDSQESESDRSSSSVSSTPADWNEVQVLNILML